MTAHITKRFDLNVGKRCNERCLFCYYLEEIESGDTHDLSTGQVMQILRLGRKYGKTRVDLTGGEPTIRKDLPDLIRYAAEIGYETRCIITNGLATASERQFRRLREAGLNDILLSLHAHDAETHDYLVRRKGAHARVIQSMVNAKRLGVNLRINHVVNNLNYKDVSKLAGLAAEYRPDALNFIVFNPTRDAINADSGIDITYSDIAGHLAAMLEEYGDSFPALNVRHIPFCILKGHEAHVKTMWQLQYERVEWDWCLDIIHKRGLLFMWGAALFGSLLMRKNPRFYHSDWNTRLHDALQMARIYNDRAHAPKCRRCDLRDICDALPRSYIGEHGDRELEPYLAGTRISDPAHFIPPAEREDPPTPGDRLELPDTPVFLFGLHKGSLTANLRRLFSPRRKGDVPAQEASGEKTIVWMDRESGDKTD
jgi:MoaA/NifB/PqqE/SkfB family radical SAM enzyme